MKILNRILSFIFTSTLVSTFAFGASQSPNSQFNNQAVFTQKTMVYSSLPSDYQNLLAAEKLDLLWAKITQSEWQDLPPFDGRGWSSILKNLRSLFSLAKTFDHSSDEIPKGRVKFIHTYGSVAKFEYIPVPGHEYTGIYESGAYGLIRLSLAGNPDQINYTPGAALKFLVDGIPSLNIVVMNNLEGQGQNRNFFANDFSNKIPGPRTLPLRILEGIFKMVRKPANDLPVGHLGYYQNDGAYVNDAVVPSQLIFKPSSQVSHLIQEDSKIDVREELAMIPDSSTLYHVYALQGQAEQKIGDIVLRSKFLASKYGDKNLFFQHRR